MSSANWYNGKSINEVEFCTEFMQNRPLKCISGKLLILTARSPTARYVMIFL